MITIFFFALLGTGVVLFLGGRMVRPHNENIFHDGWFADYRTAVQTFVPPSLHVEWHWVSLACHLAVIAAIWAIAVWQCIRVAPLRRKLDAYDHQDDVALQRR